MSAIKATDFPDTKICKDSEKANYQNYLAWQVQVAQRRRESQTQFNMFQSRAYDRMSSQVAYKEEAVENVDTIKEQVDRRLSKACDCENCASELKGRSNSDSSVVSSSPTTSEKSCTGSIRRDSNSEAWPPTDTTAQGPMGPSSKNSLIVSPPPRSRHHKRKCHSVSVA